MLYSNFLNFYLKSFLCSGIPSRYHTAFGCHVSRASFWLWQFLGLYCQVFCRTSFGWDLSCTFLTVMVFERKTTQEKMPFLFHRIKGTDHQHDPSLAAGVGYLAEGPSGCSARSRSLPPLHCPLRKGVAVRGLHLEWGACSSPEEWGSTGTTRSPPHRRSVSSPFTHSIVYLHDYGLRYFLCWVIIQ